MNDMLRNPGDGTPPPDNPTENPPGPQASTPEAPGTSDAVAPPTTVAAETPDTPRVIVEAPPANAVVDSDEQPAPQQATTPETTTSEAPAPEATPAVSTDESVDVDVEAPLTELAAESAAAEVAQAEDLPEVEVDAPTETPEPPVPIHKPPSFARPVPQVSTTPPRIQLAQDAHTEPFPIPGGPGSHPAPFDPRQAPAWQTLLAEYEREIAAIGDVPAAAPLYFESGKILEEKLSQPHNAWDYYKKAFQLNPRLAPNIRAARRLASQMGNWNSTVLVLDSEIQATDDAHDKAHLLHRRGRILEEKLGRVEEARSSYEQAVELDRDNVEILKQLERLAISASDWAKVLEVRIRLLGLIQDPAVSVQLLLSCARIYELHFQDKQKSESLYCKVLEIDTVNLPALTALRLYYDQTKRYEELLEIVWREAQATSEPSAAAWLYYQAARLLREQLGDEERALQSLAKALGLSPGNVMVLSEMAHIFENLMRWQELVNVHEQQLQVITDRQEMVSLNFNLGSLWEEKLFNEDRAIEHYRRVVELNPNYLPALQALGKLFYRKGQWEQLVQMYEVEVRETQDPRSKSVKCYKLAEILEERLSRDEEAIQKLEQCLELNPGYLPALKALGRLYNKYHRWESLVRMYETELSNSKDMDQKIFLLDKMGNIWEERLNNIDKAIETFQRLLELSPNHLPAIRMLGKLYVRADRWEDMIRINELEAQLVNDQKQVVSLLHRTGEIYEEKLNMKDEAIEMYRKVLALAPSYLPALQSLGRLFFVKGRWEDLIAMHRQEIEVTQNADQQIALLYKIGQLYEEKLVQEDKAIVSYQEVLRIQSTNSAAMKALIRIYGNKRDWENLIEIYQKEAAVLEDPLQKAVSLFQVAEIWEHHLSQPKKAIETLQQILQVTPDHAPSVRALVRLYTKEENWRLLLAVHERELQQATHEVHQINILSRMAELYNSRINDLIRAAECYEKILSIRPDHLPSIEALERIYLNQRNYGALVRIYDSYAARTTDAHLKLALQSQIADIKENRVQPPQNAGENYLRILALNPLHAEAIRSLDILYTKFGTWKGLRLLYEQELQRVRTVDEAVDLCMRIADLAESRLQLPAAAIHYYREALRLSENHLPAIKALKRLSYVLNDFPTLIGLLEREGQVTRDSRQAIGTLLQAAHIFRTQFNDPGRAIECLFRVLEREPREVQAFTQLETMLIQQTDWDRLSVLYRNRLSVIEDTRALSELYLKLGGLLREKLQRSKDASAYFRKALEINPSNLAALSQLAEMAFDSGDWDTSIQLGLRLLELTTDPAILTPCHFRLGIIYQEKKPDLELAITHLQKVQEIAPSDLASLQRLKAIHFARQQWNDVIQAINRLIEVDRDPTSQIKYHLEKAGTYETGLNDPEQAVAAYRRVLEFDPNNVAVIQKLGELYERLERWMDLTESYQSFARLLAPGRAHEAIPLHMKMGRLFVERLNNIDKAILEYKRVTEISPFFTDAHVALATLYGRTGLYYANAVEEHRKLLEINPFRIESYHELRRIFEEQRAFDKVLCSCAALHFLRTADQNEEFFYGENHSKIPERSNEQLNPDEIETLVIHPDERGLVREIIKVVGAHVSKAYPPNLERHGVGKGNRTRPEDPLRTLCDSMVANLGSMKYEVYHSTQPGYSVICENTEPVSLVVGDGLVKRTMVREQRFALGRAIKLCLDGSFLALQLGEKELALFIGALVQPIFPTCPAAAVVANAPDDLPKRLGKILPRKARAALEELLKARAPELGKMPDYPTYLRGVMHSANRVGLIMSNDLSQAVMHLTRDLTELRGSRLSTTEEIANALSRFPSICELLRFAVSEEYFRLRTRMRYTIVN